jgi:hypothetical protein
MMKKKKSIIYTSCFFAAPRCSSSLILKKFIDELMRRRFRLPGGVSWYLRLLIQLKLQSEK